MYRWLIIAALISVISGAAYYYYSTTQSKIETLIANNATLESNMQTVIAANESAIKAIDELQNDYTEIQDNYLRIESEFQEIRLQNEILSDKLEDNDLGRLAAARPEMVQRIINNASDNALRCFELLSGAPLTEDERNAESAKEFNSECPFLWNP